MSKFPVIVPGINFTLDANFQFSLVICGMLAYIDFLKNYWSKNLERLNLSKSFLDFIFWDLPNFKLILAWIPFILAIPICIQLAASSYWLSGIFLIILVCFVGFIVWRFSYHLSSDRKMEKTIDSWLNDNEWFEIWKKRIQEKIVKYGNVAESDLYEAGLRNGRWQDGVEIRVALRKYFKQYEFQENLVLVKTSDLPISHPRWGVLDPELILLKRENLSLKKS